METVSPILYTKLDFSKFSTTYNENYDNLGNSGYEKNKISSKVLYDSVTKKIVQFSEDSIKIFNRDLSMIKKNMKLRLSIEKLSKVSVEKQLRYMLVNMDQKLLILNLRTEKVCDILHLESNNLLGFFFISYYHIHPSYYNEDVRFCLVFTDKIVFHKLNINLNDHLSEIKITKVDTIREYFFNPQFLVLLIRKSDYEFEFYNILSEKFYYKPHGFELPNKLIEKKSPFAKFFGMFSKKEEKKAEVLSNEKVNKETLYKKTHFFLETIYKKLYFICVNYEDKEIQIFNVIALNNLKRSFVICFDPSQIITLQFIDNLILIHNFDRLDTILIDIKSESSDKIIFKNFPMSNYDIYRQNQEKYSDLIKTKIEFNPDNYEVKLKIDYNFIETKSMLEYENKMFYDLDLIIEGCMMIDRINNEVYHISFDPLIYYENSDVKYECVFNLIRRKNSKEVILNSLYDLIKSKYSVKTINIIYQKIVTNLYKTLYDKSLQEFNNSIENLSKNSSEIVNPRQYFLIKRKSIVKQTDIYYHLFKQLDSSINVDFDYALKSLIHFIMSLVIQPSFQSTLICLLRKVKSLNILNIFLQYHLLPDSMEFALFLIEISNKENELGIYFNEGFQLGLDMLVRLKKYEEIFRILISNNKFYECLIYLKQNKIKVEYLSTETKRLLEKTISQNKSLVIDFLNLS